MASPASPIRAMRPPDRCAFWTRRLPHRGSSIISCTFCFKTGRPALATQSESMEPLTELGFKVNPKRKYCRDIDDLVEFCKEWDAAYAILCPSRSTAWWQRSTPSRSRTGWVGPRKLRAGPSPTSSPPRQEETVVGGHRGARRPHGSVDAGGTSEAGEHRRRHRLARDPAQRR